MLKADESPWKGADPHAVLAWEPRSDAWHRVRLSGDLDAADSACVRLLGDAALALRPARLTVDVGDVAVFTSAAALALDAVRQAAQAAGIEFAVVGIGSVVRTVLDVLGLFPDMTDHEPVGVG